MFSDYSIYDRIELTKKEFIYLLRAIFDEPENLKSMVSSKQITNIQGGLLFKNLDKLNFHSCVCCRVFDPKLVKLNPIDEAFEPILAIAQINVRAKY